MLSSASTETATGLAPAKSASTPPTAPPEAADYSGFNRIYSFRSGQSYLDVTVKTNKDTTKENTEYFYGRISAYRSGDRNQRQYTISRSSSTINEGSNTSKTSIVIHSFRWTVLPRCNRYTISRRSSSAATIHQ